VSPPSAVLNYGQSLVFLVQVTTSSGLRFQDDKILRYYYVSWNTTSFGDSVFSFTYANIAFLDTRRISITVNEIMITLSVVPLSDGDVHYEGEVTEHIPVTINP
jgi:hypothetical protein